MLIIYLLFINVLFVIYLYIYIIYNINNFKRSYEGERVLGEGYRRSWKEKNEKWEWGKIVFCMKYLKD